MSVPPLPPGVRPILTAALACGGVAVLALGTPSAVSAGVAWTAGMGAAAAALHLCSLLVRTRGTSPGATPAPAMPAPTSGWVLAHGWQAARAGEATCITRPDGRQFLLTDRSQPAAAGQTVVVWQPGRGPHPTRAQGCWTVGGTRADVVRLLEAL